MLNRKNELTSFCLIFMLAIALRFAGICSDSLWLDEAYQSMVGACGHGRPDFSPTKNEKFLFSFGDSPESPELMLSRFRQVDPLCPPLYAYLLNRWLSVFGNSDFAIRSLSAIISSLQLLVLMLFSRSILGFKAARWAGLLLAISPFDIHYAQEARMYSLISLSSILSAASLILILKSQLQEKKSLLLLPLYAISTWAMINSHYTCLFLALVEGLAASAYLLFRRSFRVWLLLLVAWVSCLLLWLPWLDMFFSAAALRKESFYVARVPDLIWPFKALLRIPINWLIFLSGQRVIAYAAFLYLSSASMLAFAFHKSILEKDNEKRFELFSLWIWALAPALILYLSDLLENHKVIEVSRYLIYTQGAIFMLAGYGLSCLLKFKRAFLLLAAAHILFASVNLIYTHTVRQREPWKEMAQKVEELISPDRTLIVSQHYNIACLDRYLTTARIQKGMSPAMGKQAVAELLSTETSFALITAQEGESIKNMVPPEFRLVKQVDFAHGLHLRIYER